MSSTDDANFIGTKKGSTSKKPVSYSNYLNFFLAVLKIIILLLITIFFGSGILYSCKVATANILPTDIDCAPYSSSEPIIEPIDTDVDITKIDGVDYSRKIHFPFNKSHNINKDPKIDEAADYNKLNFILDWIRKQKEVYNSWGIKMFFISVIESLFLTNYSTINTILHFMDKYLYEFIILIFGPMILLILLPFVSLYSFFYSIFSFFTNLTWIFKENINKKVGSLPKWEDVTFMNAYNFGISCFLGFWILMLSLVLYTLGFALVTTLSSMIFILCLISAILMKSFISEGHKIGEPYGVFKTFTDMLTSKNRQIMILISIIIIFLSFAYLGAGTAVFTGIISALLVSQMVRNKIFTKDDPKNLTPNLYNPHVDQAKKTCKKIVETAPSVLNNNTIQQEGGENGLLMQLQKLSSVLKQ